MSGKSQGNLGFYILAFTPHILNARIVLLVSALMFKCLNCTSSRPMYFSTYMMAVGRKLRPFNKILLTLLACKCMFFSLWKFLNSHGKVEEFVFFCRTLRSCYTDNFTIIITNILVWWNNVFAQAFSWNIYLNCMSI